MYVSSQTVEKVYGVILEDAANRKKKKEKKTSNIPAFFFFQDLLFPFPHKKRFPPYLSLRSALPSLREKKKASPIHFGFQN
jgi:hypothetical protein